MRTGQDTWEFALTSHQDRHNALVRINNLDLSEDWELVIRRMSGHKTMKQLGALFGLWYRALEDVTGNPKRALHQVHKEEFLAPIYIADPRGKIQETWVELYCLHRDHDDILEAAKVMRRISLAWATKQQMSLYMQDLDHFYADQGICLPVPDKYHRVYRRAA